MPVPASLEPENINQIWREINAAKQTKDPQQWEEVVGRVRVALEDWRKTVTKWPDLVRKYNLVKAAAARAEGDKKQELLDRLQAWRESMPPKVREAADTGKKLVPIKLRSIEDMLHTLEGVRQGDFEAYGGPIKRELANWETSEKLEQHKLHQQLKNFEDRLYGVQDENRRQVIQSRIAGVEKDKEFLERQRQQVADPAAQARYDERLDNYDKEVANLQRRLEGAKKPETREKLIRVINNLQHQIRTPEEIHQEMLTKAKDAKYDALMWMVTNIAMPKELRVLKTKQPYERRPMKAPYMPPEPEEKEMPGAEEFDEPETPNTPETASECRILLGLLSEEKYNSAIKFWRSPYYLEKGDLVQLVNHKYNGLKGYVRSIDENVVVDLFKNNLISESHIEITPHQAYPYLRCLS